MTEPKRWILVSPISSTPCVGVPGFGSPDADLRPVDRYMRLPEAIAAELVAAGKAVYLDPTPAFGFAYTLAYFNPNGTPR